VRFEESEDSDDYVDDEPVSKVVPSKSQASTFGQASTQAAIAKIVKNEL